MNWNDFLEVFVNLIVNIACIGVVILSTMIFLGSIIQYIDNVTKVEVEDFVKHDFKIHFVLLSILFGSIAFSILVTFDYVAGK